MQMSEAAKKALIDAKSSRQGARVQGDAVVITELFDLGLVGDGDGLTRKGTIARYRAVTEALDKAFG